MIIVLGQLAIKDAAFSEIERPLHDLLAATRRDDGCMFYTFARDVENPNLIRFSERWRDQAAIDAHNAQPHMAALQAAVGPHLANAPKMLFYEADEARSQE